MPLNLNGKYWQVSELEKALGVPRFKIFPIIKALEGVIKIGVSYLIPDEILPSLRLIFEQQNRVTIGYAAFRLKIGLNVMRGIISNGFPKEEVNSTIFIKKSDLPSLELAVNEIRQQDGKVSYLRSKDIAQKAIEYLSAKHTEGQDD